MSTPKPVPLYPAYTEFKSLDLTDFPEVKALLEDGPEWRLRHWRWGQEFLAYTGRNKSEHTFSRFRNEIERFLLWTFLFKDKPIDDMRKTDILEYADFCWQPPVSWISLVSSDRFSTESGQFVVKKDWRPFRLKLPKNQPIKNPDKKKYKPSQMTLKSTFTAVIAFYKYLMNEEICFGNPAQIAKSDCRHFISDVQVKEIRRLSEDQWLYVFQTAEDMANSDSLYERSLFVIASLKTLFLRISELSERNDWSPEMGHFWQDEDHNWWLKIYGKGRKLRDVTVPDGYLKYIKRYRSYRGLTPLPYPGDNASLVEKIRGRGGMTSRHLTRLVQEVFDEAYERMKRNLGEDRAKKLQEASTHWLRHTGASMEIERGRALKDLSEDLGHASMATTDTVYVQSEHKKRAASGKKRPVR